MAHILLLAEPSLTIQRVVQLTFANEDIDVVVASDGAEAIEQAERIRPSIVLADVALARMNGYDVAAHFKRHPRFAGVPVVLLSGAFERIDAARAKASGCDLVLSKPFEPRHLLAHVRGLLPGAPTGVTPEDVALDGAARATVEGFVSVPPHSGHATAIDPMRPERRVEPEVARPAFEEIEPRYVAPEPIAAPAAPPPPAPEVAGVPEIPLALPVAFADWNLPELPQEPAKPRRPVEPQPPTAEPVPSFEMLALTNKSMHLVPPPAAEEPEADVEVEADTNERPRGFDPVQSVQSAGNDLGDLMPSLDDYFDQLDAAFASGPDTAFRRPPDVPPPAAPQPPPAPKPMAAPPTPPLPPPAAPDPVRYEAPIQAPSIDRRKPSSPAMEPAEERAPAVSPFSTLRLEPPDPKPAPATSATIDDAYDALMKQLQEPKPRPSVVALRADDELLVERAVERVLAQLDATALREAMTDVVTNLTKKVIAEEIERIRRP